MSKQFTQRDIAMIKSPAHRALSLSAHRLLLRLEIELASHGGHNGSLPVTYAQLKEFGIRRNSIKATIEECVALGFIRVTKVGRAGAAEERTPSEYRLTYRPTNPRGGRVGRTDEWRQVTDKQARSIAKGKPSSPPKMGAEKPSNASKVLAPKTIPALAPKMGSGLGPQNGGYLLELY